jgi:CheY-like chemotaxis protein
VRALCVGRHRFLSQHIASVFRAMGLETTAAVGLDEAVAAARPVPPDVVLCDYDLLAALPLDRWERDPLLSRRPVIAVSLTRRSEERPLHNVNGIAGSLYLPTLRPEDALRVLRAAERPIPSYSFGNTPQEWPRVPRQAPAR